MDSTQITWFWKHPNTVGYYSTAEDMDPCAKGPRSVWGLPLSRSDLQASLWLPGGHLGASLEASRAQHSAHGTSVDTELAPRLTVESSPCHFPRVGIGCDA
jgi:hypothetical protein